MAHIRPYKDSDAEAVSMICRATLPPSLAGSPCATRLAPYMWALPFTVLSPSTCFVLDDGSGAAVGYVVGHPDVGRMTDEYAAYVSFAENSGDVGPVPSMDQLQPWNKEVPDDDDPVNEECLRQHVYNPLWLLRESPRAPRKRTMTDTFRATMHINLLPRVQGGGWGRRLVDTFVAAVTSEGATGLHIGISGENLKVRAFYERLDFCEYPGWQDEGSLWMVRDLKTGL